MNETVKIAEAKAHFSELVARAEAGEEILIARGNQPVARIVPLGPKPPRRPGIAAHWKDDPVWQALDKALGEPLTEEDLAAAEGALSDEFGISLSPGSKPPTGKPSR